MVVRGCGNLCSDARSLFFLIFLFTEKAKNPTPARASMRYRMLIDETHMILILSIYNTGRQRKRAERAERTKVNGKANGKTIATKIAHVSMKSMKTIMKENHV